MEEACVLPSGVAAIFPGDDATCRTLGPCPSRGAPDSSTESISDRGVLGELGVLGHVGTGVLGHIGTGEQRPARAVRV